VPAAGVVLPRPMGPRRCQLKVWKYGDDINTDMLFPGKYTYTRPRRRLSRTCSRISIPSSRAGCRRATY
jgi:aconitase B